MNSTGSVKPYTAALSARRPKLSISRGRFEVVSDGQHVPCAQFRGGVERRDEALHVGVSADPYRFDVQQSHATVFEAADECSSR